MNDAVLFDAREDGIAIITLNRPDARNALGKDIRAGLFAAWERFEHDAKAARCNPDRRGRQGILRRR
jgi:enoyl-CoA hydratase/carnithine racemase